MSKSIKKKLCIFSLDLLCLRFHVTCIFNSCRSYCMCNNRSDILSSQFGRLSMVKLTVFFSYTIKRKIHIQRNNLRAKSAFEYHNGFWIFDNISAKAC